MNLSIDLGVKEYSINEKTSLFFNPTDMAFIEKVFTLFDTLDAIQDRYMKTLQSLEDEKEVFSHIRNMNAEMREKIDEVFGEGICDAIFGDVSVFAVSGGIPLWANLILAIIDIMDEQFTEEKKQTNSRIKKYIEKYKKK